MWYSAIEFGIGRSLAEGKNLLVVTVILTSSTINKKNLEIYIEGVHLKFQ